MFLQDLRHGIRALRRRPGFSLAAALTLAIGIGATTAIYSTLRAVLWRPLPYPAAHELVMISSTDSDAPMAVSPNSVSPPDFTDWRTLSTGLAEMAAFSGGGYSLTGNGNAERVPGTGVTGGFFQVLGTPALVGRTLQHVDDEAGGAAVAVASGVGAFSLGGDGGGSIRIPAGFCGIVGFKPSFGAIPREPCFPSWQSLVGSHQGSVRVPPEMFQSPCGARAAPFPRVVLFFASRSWHDVPG